MRSVPDTIPELAESLGSERDALLVSVAALQLIPENATKWMRFERLVEACAGAPTDVEQKPVSVRRLSQLLTSPPIVTPSLVAAEDPFEESFTAEITFYGGSYMVVMGGASAAHSACQLVLEAVRQIDAAPSYRESVFADAAALLRLSDAMCKNAGLGRWAAPTESPRTPLHVPGGDELERLQQGVLFDSEQIAALLGHLTSHIDELVAPGPMEIVEHDDESQTDDRIYLYPLLRTGDGVVVPVPGAIAGAIVHRALLRGTEAGLREGLVEALHQTALGTIGRCLDRVRWVPVATPERLEQPSKVRESFWRFDVDKVAHVVTVVDLLHDYEAGRPYASVDLRSIQDELHRRFTAVRKVRGELGASNVLHIVCSAVLGRSWSLGFTDEATDEGSALLVLTIDDLDILTGLEPADPAAMWKFARASTALHRRCKVMSFSKLDEFALFTEATMTGSIWETIAHPRC